MKKSKQRSVRFASETNICLIPSSLDDETSSEERNALWYTIHDLSCMRNESKRLCEEIRD